MKLIEVYNYLEKNGLSDITKISISINETTDVTRELLNYWISKDKVLKFLSDQSCCTTGKGCSSCTLLTLEMYDLIK